MVKCQWKQGTLNIRLLGETTWKSREGNVERRMPLEARDLGDTLRGGENNGIYNR